MRLVATGAVILGLLCNAAIVSAQQADGPIVRAEIKPSRVIVGQRAVLSLDVLAPNYMPAPPVLPDFQVRNLVTRQMSARNFVEQRDDVTYAGVRYEFAISPMEAGAFAISGQSVTITYAAEPPAARTVSIAIPELDLQAFIPPQARDLNPFVSANNIAIGQTVDRSSRDLKVGDSITRTVTVTADGIPAMLIPPVVFAPVDGFAIYPSQPALQDVADSRSGSQKGIRIEQAVYLLQKTGDYNLPPISLGWWNVRDQKVERAQADGVELHVADNPAVKSSAGLAAESWRARWDISDSLQRHWQMLVIILAGAGILIWKLPLLTRACLAWRDRRRKAYRESEAFYFAQIRRAAGSGDARKTYFSWLDWLDRFEPLGRVRSAQSLKRAANDPALNAAIDALEQNLFGSGAAALDPRAFISHLSRARRRLLHRQHPTRAAHPLPVDINPMPMKDGIQTA
jgi:hypothetical protein